MKNLLTATLPALALLALGGCAASGALTSSSETDGAYYGAKDHTTAVGSPVTTYSGPAPDGQPAAASPDNANPDYQGGTAQSSNPDYYDNNYAGGYGSGFGQPYMGPGVSSYNYSPSWGGSSAFYNSPFAYSPFGYGYGGGFGGFGNPYGGFYDPFYSSFYSPFYTPFYGGSLISFNFIFGNSPFGYGYGRPFYGGYGYDPYGYGYGGGSYYGNHGGGGYYGRPIIYSNGGSRGPAGSNPLLVGPRGGRGGSVMSDARATADPNQVSIGRRSGGSYSPTGGVASPDQSGVAPDLSTGRAGREATNFGGGQEVSRRAYPGPGSPTTSGQSAATNLSQPQSQPQPDQGRRGFFNGFFGGGQNQATGNNGNGSNGQPVERRGNYNQPQPQYGSSQPSRRDYTPAQPSYSQPAQPQRSYSQPTERSYSQPSRSAESSSGGSFGGGSSSGGGSSGGGGGSRRGH